MTEPPGHSPRTIGPYRIDSTLGEGGMGEVHRGFDPRLERHVALKVLSPALAQDEESRRRFLREARSAAGLTHPNVAQVYEIGESEGHPYIAMELVEGRSLETLLATQGRLHVQTALDYMLQVATGLEAAWKKGIVHRDIKPANVLVTSDGLAKIVDFGLSKVYGGDKSLTQSGMVMGTPRYMSPEQGEGKPLDFRSDIYSLGATFYHLLVGSPPYDADTPVSVIVKHITAPVPVLSQVDPDLPRPICTLIERMMAKDPAERPQSYAELRTELGRTLQALSGSAPPIAPPPDGTARVDTPAATAPPPTVALPTRSPDPPSRSRVLLPAGVLLVIAAIVLFIVKTQGEGPESVPPAPTRTIPATPAEPPSDAAPSEPSPPSPDEPEPDSKPDRPSTLDEPQPTSAPAEAPTPGDDSAQVQVPAAPPAGPAAIPTPPPPPPPSQTPYQRAEVMALATVSSIEDADFTRGRRQAQELLDCIQAGRCDDELQPAVYSLLGTMAAREGDSAAALDAFREALSVNGDPLTKVPTSTEGAGEWAHLAEVVESELGRFRLTPEDAVRLIPDFPTAAQQLEFAHRLHRLALDPEADAVWMVAYDRVLQRFPDDLDAYVPAADAITLTYLRGRAGGPAIQHLERVLVTLRDGGAPWQTMNDQLVFLAVALIESRDIPRARAILARAKEISRDPSDPVRLLTPPGQFRELPLSEALERITSGPEDGRPRPPIRDQPRNPRFHRNPQ